MGFKRRGRPPIGTPLPSTHPLASVYKTEEELQRAQMRLADEVRRASDTLDNARGVSLSSGVRLRRKRTSDAV